MGYNVVWPAEKFDENKTINVNFKNAPLSIVLNHTLDGQNISYAIKNKTIVLKANRLNEVSQDMISGLVTNLIDNAPLKGVTVILNGSSTVTQTDANGRYNIKASKGTLKFSFVGFADTLININGRSTINVMMIPAH